MRRSNSDTVPKLGNPYVRDREFLGHSTCSSLAYPSITETRFPARLERRAAEWARGLRVHPRGRFLFVGSGTGYSLATYAAFKIHEVLGLSAQYQHTEQLAHSQLFSLQNKTDNLLFLSPSSDKKTSEVFRALSNNGFNAYLLKSGARDPILAALRVMFCVQHLALNLGRRMGLRECAFLTDKKRLALSSRLIY